MPIRLSGMQSGLDTEALVSALVMGYRTKKEDYEKAQTKLSWKQDKWKSINTKITNFYTGTLASNKLTSAYNLKKATINNSSYATVSASTSAVSGTQSLKVTKLASTGYLTGGKISGSNKAKLTGSSKLSEVKGMGSVADGASISVTADGKTSTIDLSSDMTISQFVVKLKNAGLTASFDENNQRFFISSKSSGADNDFSMTAANSNGKNALGALKLQATTADTVAKDIAKYQTIAGTDKNTYIADTAKSNYDATIEQYNTAIEKLKTSNAELEEKNKKLAYQKQYVDSFIEKANYTGTGDGIYNPTTLDEARKYLSDRESELEAKKTDGTITDDEKLELEAVKTVSKTVSDDTLVFTRTQKTDDDGNVSYTSDVDSLLTSTEASITSNNETIAANNTSINQYYTEAGVDSTNAAQVDSTNGKILLSYSDAITGSNSLATGYQAAATTQYEYAVSMVEAYNAYTAGTATDSQKELLGLSTSSSTDTTSAVRIAGSNAQIELNGAVFENTTNNFSINGLTIQATALTGNEAVTITTDTDVDGIYDTIKDMLSEYNELIKTLDTAYNAESAKGYEPLTDDEKESMSDDEVEKWETKIKDSLLRNDGTLSSVVSSMKNSMLAGITIDGKTYNLSDFGISTGSYFSTSTNEKGVYHIDGDEDDSTSKGNTDKLKAAIANDSDTVIKFFSQLANNLYSTLNKKLGTSNSMSSYMSIYNDKEMATQYSEYKTKISDQETKISTWEDYYYKKFSRMESALASLNSQASSISGLFG
mgnify:CR=1 FL=1